MHIARAERSLPVSTESAWEVIGDYMNVDHFNPLVSKVDKLSDESRGLGAIRRCHAPNGSSLLEQVTSWQEGRSFTVRILEATRLPFSFAEASMGVEPEGGQHTRAFLEIRFQVRYGLLGRLLGATVMPFFMRRTLSKVLAALEEHLTTPLLESESANESTMPRLVA